MSILLVCGGRDYADKAHVWQVLTTFHAQKGIGILIQGGATGADKLAKDWADQYGVHHADVPALWDFYSKGAGPRRNSAMLLLRPEFLIAFPGGRGTEDMISKATKAGIPVSRATVVRGET